MIPDVWYLVPLLAREHTHELPDALLYCIPAGLLAYAAFHLIFKQPLIGAIDREGNEGFSCQKQNRPATTEFGQSSLDRDMVGR